MTLVSLPFNQYSPTVMFFDLGPWRFYFNYARKNDSKWISRRTKPTGFYTKAKDGRGGFVHRLTAVFRQQSGVKYLQVICFAWWMAVVRKDQGQFVLNQEE